MRLGTSIRSTAIWFKADVQSDSRRRHPSPARLSVRNLPRRTRKVTIALEFIPKLVCHWRMSPSVAKNRSAQRSTTKPAAAAIKTQLASEIRSEILERHLSQSEAARLLGIPQPKISAIFNDHLAGFSVERLFRILNGLGRDIVISVRRHDRKSNLGGTYISAA